MTDEDETGWRPRSPGRGRTAVAVSMILALLAILMISRSACPGIDGMPCGSAAWPIKFHFWLY